VSCRHHLAPITRVAVQGGGSRLLVRFQPEEAAEALLDMQETCALDVAEREGVTLVQIGQLLGIGHERVRQLEETERAAAARKEDLDVSDLMEPPRRVHTPRPKSHEEASPSGSANREVPVGIVAKNEAAAPAARRYPLQDPEVRAKAIATRMERAAAARLAAALSAPAEGHTKEPPPRAGAQPEPVASRRARGGAAPAGQFGALPRPGAKGEAAGPLVTIFQVGPAATVEVRFGGPLSAAQWDLLTRYLELARQAQLLGETDG